MIQFRSEHRHNQSLQANSLLLVFADTIDVIDMKTDSVIFWGRLQEVLL